MASNRLKARIERGEGKGKEPAALHLKEKRNPRF